MTWIRYPNESAQRIDLSTIDPTRLASLAERLGARVERGMGPLEGEFPREGSSSTRPASAAKERSTLRFEPPLNALEGLFRVRFTKIYRCLTPFEVDMNRRPTSRVLGGYYRSLALVRVYTHDRETGRRPMEELFDTFLHEMAHHIEYTEPDSYHARECGRVHGRMHSRLFWRILGDLKGRWADLQAT